MMSYQTDSSKWKALTTRDPLASGHFVYAVQTTRIYCRPNCPSRLARRANVRFFGSGPEAQDAGFRACLRCRPDALKSATVGGDGNDNSGAAVQRACEIMTRAKGRVKFGDVAKEVGLSTRYLYGRFKAEMGMTPGHYARTRNLGALEGPGRRSAPTTPSMVGDNGGSNVAESDRELDFFDLARTATTKLSDWDTNTAATNVDGWDLESLNMDFDLGFDFDSATWDDQGPKSLDLNFNFGLDFGLMP